LSRKSISIGHWTAR